ncbi:hypothetical protein MNBD_CHLOROFLEXI01-3859, partial [hydrothermal vent metagenome]
MRRSLTWLLLCFNLIACATVSSSPQASPTLIPSLQPSISPSPLPPSGVATVTPTHLPQPTVTVSPPILPSPTPLPLPQWENGLDVLMRETAVSQSVPFHQLLPSNSGAWQYDSGAFLHPIAFAMNDETAFLLDGGRVLVLNLIDASPPQILLQPDDIIEELPVQEPLDLALIGEQLLVLDRTGDVYRLDLQTISLELAETAVWQLERYERPIGETSSDYFVALGQDMAGSDMRLRLESSYSY